MIRAVLDTNTLVSAAIRPNGEAGKIIKEVRQQSFLLLYSSGTLTELVDVLNRPRLKDKYQLTPPYLHLFFNLIRLRGEKVIVTKRVAVCRDPDDDLFLAVALAGKADFVVTNDSDLLILSPFAGIPIIPPTDFLKQLSLPHH